MSAPLPIVLPANLAVINPSTGRFDDSLAPPSVAANAQIAYEQAVIATNMAAAATAAAAQATGGPDAAASAAAASAAQAAATTAAAAAVAAQHAAEAAAAGAGGGASQGAIDQAIAGLGAVARTNSYGSLDNKPAIPDSADDIGAIALTAVGAAGGIPQLDVNKHALYDQAPAGSVFDYFCAAPTFDVQPARATLSTRTDIYFRWFKKTAVSTAAGYAIPRDRWVPWSG